MKDYTQYSLRTGKIIGQISLPETDEAYDLHSVSLVEGKYNGDTHYINHALVEERPDMELAVSRLMISVPNGEFVSVTGVPFGANLIISHPELGYMSQKLTSTEYIYKPQIPGKFTFTFSCFPYKDATFDITAYSLEL